MKKALAIAILILLFLGALFLTVSYINAHNIPVLNPKGMIAMQQRDLIVICSLLMCIVVIPAYILTALFSWRYREGNKKAKYTPNWAHSTLGEVIWWGVPCVIIVILAVITWVSTHALNPFTPIASEKKPVQIQVVALDWKWLFIYPEQGIATVNYIQFPEKTPLNFDITADAPMNSFWIPQLGGQIYAMPAMRTKLHLIANEEGSFRGVSANISGEGFAGMSFTAVATSDEAFDAWVKSVQESPNQLTLEEYEELMLPSKYNPVTVYSSVEEGLFDHIMMKYMHPSKEK